MTEETTLQNYQALAIRTDCLYGEELANRAANLHFTRLLHAGIGLGTESGELLHNLNHHFFLKTPIDIPNLFEESGDLCWYLALLLDELGSSFEAILPVTDHGFPHTPLLHTSIQISIESSNILDELKRFLFYGKLVDPNSLLKKAASICCCVSLLLDELGSDFETIMKMNIDKLRARYPQKFTEHHALNRDLEKEREILEAATVGGE